MANIDYSQYGAENDTGVDYSQYGHTPENNDHALTPEEIKKNGTEMHYWEPSFGEKLAPNILAGLAQMGHGLINAPHNLVNQVSPKLASYIPKQQDYDFAGMLKLPKSADLSDKLIRGLAQYSPALLAPEASLGEVGGAIKSIPYAGRMLKKMIGNALPVGAFSATQNEENPGTSAAEGAAATTPFSALSSLATTANPYAKLAGRLGLAGLGGYGGYKGAEMVGADSLPAKTAAATLGASLGLIGKTPKSEARENMLKGVEGSNYKEKLEAGQRLGLDYLTPAEVSSNPFVAAQQGAAGKTEKGAQLLYQRGQERIESEKQAINKLFDTIYDKEKLNPEVKSLYKSSYQESVPQNFVESLKQNEVFKEAVKRMESKAAFKESLKGVPENSIGYLDHVKQSIDDMVERAPAKEQRILLQTQNKILKKMDSISPNYGQARELAERGILRKKLEDKLNTKSTMGTTFYNALLKNDKKYGKLQFSLRNVPEAQQQLKDMRSVFGDLINPPTIKTAAGLAKTGMTQERNTRQALANKLKEMLSGGKYDTAAIDLITNPNWKDELSKLKDISSFKTKASKVTDLLGRAAGSYAGSQ
jgi:hypothetical protein